MPRGGYQAPSRPAPVSGPGALSKRTDGGAGQAQRQLGNAAYGEQKEFDQIQGGAKMNAAPDAGAQAGQQARQMPPITGLGEPTQRPDEPVTAGSPSGPGGGPESIGVSSSFKEQNQLDARKIAEYLPSLERAANQPGVPPSFVRFVKYVREFKG